MAKKEKVRAHIQIEVERLDLEGRGIAHHEGKVVFIEGALPGELVTYEQIRNKPSYEVGSVVSIDRACALRVTPRCPHFGITRGSCGGCAAQHIEPSSQVAFKQGNMLDTLWHIGKVRPENVLAPIYGPFWNYRHRARLSVRNVQKKGTVLVGFHEKGSSYVADMSSCAILPKKVSDLLPAMRELIASLTLVERIPQIEIAVDADGCAAFVFRILETPSEEDLAKMDAFCLANGIDMWLQPKGPDSCYPYHPERIDALKLHHAEFGVTIPFRPTDFTQVNHAMNETMVSRAVRLLGIEPGDHVADFFCGLGNFTLPLARCADRVVGLEGSDQLVARAQAGAAANGLSEKTDFVARNLFTWCDADWEALWERMGGLDRILMDPPREGAEALSYVLAATAKKPKRIVYVSCNPATLARDCAILTHKGGWRLRAAGVMNMFPHTGHVESMAVLEPGEEPAQSPVDCEPQAPDQES